MSRLTRLLSVSLIGLLAVALGAVVRGAEFTVARIFIEYNSSANDLGFHVALDGEDWRSLKIVNPNGRTIFEVAGRSGFRNLGMTELFFEGAEPSLDEVPLEELLALFPEGDYTFTGTTVDGVPLVSKATLTHAIPSGPRASAAMTDDSVTIRWQPQASPPQGFPDRQVQIVGYQVIVGSFQVTLPASARKLTLPREFVRSLGRGRHAFEVLAIERSGNQTITEGSFVIRADED